MKYRILFVLTALSLSASAQYERAPHQLGSFEEGFEQTHQDDGQYGARIKTTLAYTSVLHPNGQIQLAGTLTAPEGVAEWRTKAVTVTLALPAPSSLVQGFRKLIGPASDRTVVWTQVNDGVESQVGSRMACDWTRLETEATLTLTCKGKQFPDFTPSDDSWYYELRFANIPGTYYKHVAPTKRTSPF